MQKRKQLLTHQSWDQLISPHLYCSPTSRLLCRSPLKVEAYCNMIILFILIECALTGLSSDTNAEHVLNQFGIYVSNAVLYFIVSFRNSHILNRILNLIHLDLCTLFATQMVSQTTATQAVTVMTNSVTNFISFLTVQHFSCT